MRTAHDLSLELARRMDDGELVAGSRLPPERDLAEAYGLARNTVRRALRALEDQGRLVRHVGRGTFVAGAPKSAAGMSGIMRDASPTDVMEVRLIIEPHVAALAATRATADDLHEIELAYRSSLSAKGIAEFEHWDGLLHQAVFRAARNVLLLDYCRAINTVRNQPQWYRLKQRSVTPELRTIYDAQHGDLFRALKERDPDAARAAMLSHLVKVRDNLLAATL